MQDEIKEILDLFKDEDVNGFIISDEIYKKLKYYITNLQEENKNRISESLSYDLANVRIKQLEKENNKLRSMLIESIETTNKAINILDKEILQGENNES